MSDLEARIAEVQTSHQSRIEYRDTGAHFGTIVCHCGNRYGLDETYRAHVNERIAHMLAPVIREREAEALREAADWMDGRRGSLSFASVAVELRQRAAWLTLRLNADNLEKP
ncbi:MAG TPA: hypothetical protein DCY59_11210 [Micrococcaceae bacterium]|nr:hypothetical protein [Micrococcaceae bacterium]